MIMNDYQTRNLATLCLGSTRTAACQRVFLYSLVSIFENLVQEQTKMFKILRYAVEFVALVFTENLISFKDLSVLKTKLKGVISSSTRQSLFLSSCYETSRFVLNAYCFMIYFWHCFIVSLIFITTVC